MKKETLPDIFSKPHLHWEFVAHMGIDKEKQLYKDFVRVIVEGQSTEGEALAAVKSIIKRPFIICQRLYSVIRAVIKKK